VKRGRVNTAKDSGSDTAAARSPLKPIKKTHKKKAVMEDTDLSKKLNRLIWLEASTKAFLEYLQLLIKIKNKTNNATFKVTAYANSISYIKTKSG